MRGDRKNHPVNILLYLVGLVIILTIGVLEAHGQHKCQGGHNCNDGSIINVDASSAPIIGGDDTIGIGLSSPSFTAAINQCLATESTNYAFGAYGKQRVISNYHCMGLAYLSAGMIEAGEYILCNAENGPLSGMPDCESAVSQYVPRVDLPAKLPVYNYDDHIEEEENHVSQLEDQMMLMSDMQAKLENLEDSNRQSQAYARSEARRKESIKQEIAERFNVEN